MHPSPRFLVALAALLSLPACSSDSSSGIAPGDQSDDGGNPEGGPSAPPECTSEVCIDVPEGGFAVEARGTTIEPGQDIQYCEVVQIPGEPGEPIYVSAIDGRMTPFSHHLNAMLVAPGSAADQATTPGQLVECLNNGRQPFGSGLRQIFSMGTPEEQLVLPEGIGHRLEGGQKIVLNYHYFNSSDAQVPAKAALAFHTTDAANATREMRRFGMYNIGIQIPAQSKASFQAQCTMANDIELVALWRHTHRWGTDFSAWRTGGASDGEHLFTKTDWEHDITFTPETPLSIAKGEGLRFECSFDNTTDHTMTFGELATDEMCILYGYFVGKGAGLAGPEDCIIVSATPGVLSPGFPCTECPDGE
jgi:hypothetical protein